MCGKGVPLEREGETRGGRGVERGVERALGGRGWDEGLPLCWALWGWGRCKYRKPRPWS